MRISIKRVIFTAALGLAVVWNLLCLLGPLPLAMWPGSLTLAAAGTLPVLIPLVFPSFSPVQEKSRYIAELNAQERVLAGVSICLVFLWAATILACLAYPL